MLNKLFFTLFMGLSIVFVSCGGDDDNPKASLSCKINGNSFSTSDVTAVKATTGDVTIAAVTNADAITIMISDNAVGTYSIGSPFTSNSGSYQNANGGGFSTTGTVSITKSTQSGIEGTFSFDVENGITSTIIKLTEGKFTANYQ